MNIPQQKFREVVFQLLYSFDLGLSSEEEMIPFLMKELCGYEKSSFATPWKKLNSSFP